MENDLDLLKLGTHGPPRRWQSLAAVLAVGASVTVAIFVILGHFAAPDRVAGIDGDAPVVLEDPFMPSQAESEMPSPDPEACGVMHRALEDINARMSEGVTEDQARYFRSRRNKLYLMMRERCGV